MGLPSSCPGNVAKHVAKEIEPCLQHGRDLLDAAAGDAYERPTVHQRPGRRNQTRADSVAGIHVVDGGGGRSPKTRPCDHCSETHIERSQSIRDAAVGIGEEKTVVENAPARSSNIEATFVVAERPSFAAR